RNLIKRRLRSIAEKNLPFIKKGFDIIVITRPQIVEKNYKKIEKDVLGALEQLKLLN
ncbi:ribonuclease P protein component, partial [Candidatus Azambacteria bacterium RIFCSPLOWO2_01_FULL_37_9]